MVGDGGFAGGEQTILARLESETKCMCSISIQTLSIRTRSLKLVSSRLVKIKSTSFTGKVMSLSKERRTKKLAI